MSSAGGSVIKIWNLVGGRLISSVPPHHMGHEDKTMVVGMLEGLDQVHKRKEEFVENGFRTDNKM